MTEPRKTPRTDALWRDTGISTYAIVIHARALEIETQELAEALTIISRDLRDIGLVRDADNIDKLLARYPAACIGIKVEGKG